MWKHLRAQGSRRSCEPWPGCLLACRPRKSSEAGRVKITGPQVGTVVILSQERSVFVEYPGIPKEAKIFLTPEIPVAVGVMVREQEGFEVLITEPLELGLKVTYWIID
ncbi:MAG: hypothetical protein Q8L46_02430 [candidate division WWE3 bacterium]|nr:hypothetical protein [candidate division WWE3 bacterium]